MLQKRNISSLKTILKHEEESIRDFTRRFGQAVQQIEFYSMDAILQNFKRSFEPSTRFFHSLSLAPPTTMEELYRRANKSSTLEANTQAATQTVMITNQLIEKDRPKGKNSMMGYAEIVQTARRWPIKPIPKATIGQPCVQMQSPMSGSVTAASDKPRFQRFQPKT